jgi:linoleoyl-CoA desaturase
LRSHHVFPNVYGSDQDIEGNPLFRLSPDHPWQPMHRYQKFYAPFGYALALLHSVFIGDWVYLFAIKYEWMREGVSKRGLYLKFFLTKVLHFAITFAIPIFVANISPLNVALTYVSVSMIVSLVFVIMLIGTHFYEGAKFPTLDSSGALAHNWAVHQLVTSCDWNPDSFWSSFFSGGSNAHACHHLFPGFSHVHYRHMNCILREQAKRFGLNYHCLSLSGMLRSHFRLLGELGRRD